MWKQTRRCEHPLRVQLAQQVLPSFFPLLFLCLINYISIFTQLVEMIYTFLLVCTIFHFKKETNLTVEGPIIKEEFPEYKITLGTDDNFVKIKFV